MPPLSYTHPPPAHPYPPPAHPYPETQTHMYQPFSSTQANRDKRGECTCMQPFPTLLGHCKVAVAPDLDDHK